jgi:hypothetical protein
MKIKNTIITCFIAIVIFTSCSNGDDQHKLLASDYRIFKGTVAWDLAKAIDDDDSGKIKQLVNKNKRLVSVVDPKYGQTLLGLAVYNEKYNSCKALVESGANPNAVNNYDGRTPLMEAADIGYSDSDVDSRYLTLLLKHGGNPNLVQKYVVYSGSQGGETPLSIACSQGTLEYVKILINAGANIHNSESDGSLLYSAMLSENPDLIIYLIQKGIDYKHPLFESDMHQKEYIDENLRTWRFDLGSEKYKKKMQIVDFLKAHGMDYRKTPIPANFYSMYDKNYLDKY